MAESVSFRTARTLRNEQIKLLRACVCLYPQTVYRNRSGHDPECPAHAMWLIQHGYEPPQSAAPTDAPASTPSGERGSDA